MRQRLCVHVAVLLMALIFWSGVPPVLAHDSSGYYAYTFGSGDLPNITYKFTNGVPDTAFKNRVNDAADAWTNVSGVNFNYVLGTGAPDNFDWLDCNEGPDDVSTMHWKNGIGYAGTRICLQTNGNIKNFRIAFDNDVNWNNQTESPASNELDTWHVAAHEFGHGTGGWTPASENGHFKQQ